MQGYDTYIEGDSHKDMWQEYVRRVNNGPEGRDGEEAIRELFWVKLCFKPGTDFITIHPAMNQLVRHQYVRKVLTTDLDPALGGSYGYRLRRSYGLDQLDELVHRLVTKPESKAACANLLHPVSSAIERDAGMQRMACLTNVQALIRQGALHLNAHFRSQNAWNSHGNFQGLHELHSSLLTQLLEHDVHLELGALVVTIVAAHLYEQDFPKATALS